MTHYLALIRKADFTDLFKYGKLHVNNDMKTNFACPVEELPSHPEIFFNLTYYANSFDSAFAYLIIHYIKVSTEGLANDVNIEEVQIYIHWITSQKTHFRCRLMKEFV